MPRNRLRQEFDFVVRSLETIVRGLAELRKSQERIMSAQDNANAALAAIAASIATLDTAVQTAVAELVAAKTSGNDAAFQAVADRLTALSATVAKDAADLSAAESPPASAPAAAASAPAAPDPAAATAPAATAEPASAPAADPVKA